MLIDPKEVLKWINHSEDMRYGMCRCGCGLETTKAVYSDVSKGWVRGEPKLFRNGHGSRHSRKVELASDTDCLIWIGGRQPNGYGRFYINGHQKMAHVVTYKHFIGPVPEGMELDHLCRNRSCINPNHLEPVTRLVNVRRGRVPKMTPTIVREIRRLWPTGVSHYALAHKFGMSNSAIWAALQRWTWKDVA